MRLNCSASVGDMVANSTTVISAETMMRPTPGTPWRLMRAKICGNMPSSAAALPDWPTSNIQPPSDPTDFSTAHTLMITAPQVPIVMRAASANGACEFCSSSFGQHAHDDRGAQHIDDGGRAQAHERGERHVALGVLDDAGRNRGALDAHVGPQRHRGGARHRAHVGVAADVPAAHELLGVEPEPAEQRDAEDRDDGQQHRPGFERADHAGPEDVGQRSAAR